MKLNSPYSELISRSKPLKRFPLTILLCLSLFVLLPAGCDVAPVKPEEVFMLYRERMNTDQIEGARNLLSKDSLDLIKQIDQKYKLEQPPEKPAILNIIDPVALPTLEKMDDRQTILNVRTLKGRLRLVRLVRADPKSPWKVDLTEELKSLQSFLQAQEALSGLQQQAGEFAASWKALDQQLEKMGGPEPEQKKPAEIRETPQKPARMKPPAKHIKKEEKKPR